MAVVGGWKKWAELSQGLGSPVNEGFCGVGALASF